MFKSEEIPEELTIKLCLQADLECAYQVAIQNMGAIQVLLNEGVTGIHSTNKRYVQEMEALGSVNAAKATILKKMGFDIRKEYHPIAFHHGVKMCRIQGDKSTLNSVIIPMNNFFKRFIASLDRGIIQNQEDWDNQKQKVDEFYNSFWVKRKNVFGDEPETELEEVAEEVDEEISETKENEEVEEVKEIEEQEGEPETSEIEVEKVEQSEDAEGNEEEVVETD